MTFWLKYVPLADVGKWLAKGWTIVDDMATAHHGRHAVLMKWTGEGEPS
jgi:hypothetical protein